MLKKLKDLPQELKTAMKCQQLELRFTPLLKLQQDQMFNVLADPNFKNQLLTLKMKH